MIDKSTIDEIRQRVLLSSVIGERVKLTQRGRNFVGLCPFHKEKTPSFQVNDERGFYHCFGCSASGDVVSFLRETEGLGFREAMETLAQRCGIQIVDQRTDDEREQAHAAQRQKDALFAINEAAATYFERCLHSHPLCQFAQQALLDRGLDSNSVDEDVQAALREFRIGYAPYGWDGLAEHLRQHGHSLPSADRVGLLVPRKSGGGYYDRFRHRLMFAVRDLRGRVIAFSGRSLPNPDEAQLRMLNLPAPAAGQEEPAKYVNSPETAIYRKRETLFGLYQARQAVRNQDSCVVVEGNFDVVSLHARGLHNVVAPLGTAFTAEQAREVKRFTANVVLLFDGDKAGERASKSAREPCQQEGLLARVATLPQGTDPDELVRQQGPDALRQCIKAARSMLEYLIDSALDQRFAADDAQARAAKIKEVTELIASEDDPTVRAMAERHADRIATRLGIADVQTFRALRQSVLQATRGAAPAQPKRVAPPETARSRARPQDLERDMLAAVLEYPELLDDPELSATLDQTEGEIVVTIAALHRSRELGEGPVELLARLPESVRGFAGQRLAAPELPDLESAKNQLLENATKLQRLRQKEQERDLIEQMHRAAQVGDFETEMALLAQIKERTRARHGAKD